MKGTFITFLDAGNSASGRTKIWIVEEKDDGGYLGRIAWYGAWRAYAFYPYTNTLFEQRCLHEIATFCETRTREHRAGWRTPTGSTT